MKAFVRLMIPAAAVASVAFASIGSTGASAAAPNLAAGQPTQWVTVAYTAPTTVDSGPLGGSDKCNGNDYYGPQPTPRTPWGSAVTMTQRVWLHPTGTANVC